MSGSLLVDTGTYYTASGFAGDDIPTSVFPTLCLEVEGSQDCFVGYEAIKQSLNLNSQTAKPIFNPSRNLYNYQELLKFSIEAAKPTDSTLNESMEFPVLLVEPLFCPKSVKEELTKFVFEDLNLPGFYITNSPICSLYATARTSGMLLESSHSGISVTAAYEGFIQSNTSAKSPSGGNFLSNALVGCCLKRKSNQTVDLLNFLRQFSYEDENMQFQLDIQKNQAALRADLSDSDIVDPITAIKHKMFVSNSDVFSQTKFEKTLSQSQKKAKEHLKLPDGNLISIDDELWILPEVLFCPEFFDFDFPGVGHLIDDSCNKLDPIMSTDVMKEVIISGGLIEIQGFERRLQRELSNSLREASIPKLVLSPTIPSSRTTRKGKSLAAWIGSSILSSVSTFQQIWVMKSDYEESGPVVVHRKMLM
eukprot:GHVP01060452.1.p1 GENE.GHVP01060452.1~~GHVP01060452.1.p1  ORF type:complete len:421 (+),score=104.35 GHVP01060452.1:56-1318(+)